MMQFRHLLANVAAITLVSISGVQAQSLRDSTTPAEFPPASFSGSQYVDSAGCVFIRAGVDGNITWVPRVTRDRKLVCGFQPSLARTTVAETAPVETAPEIIEIAPETEVAQALAEEKAVPVVATAPKPVRTVRAKPVVAMPSRVAASASARKTEPLAIAQAPTTTNCANLSPLSQRFMAHPTAEVRCGPQAERPHYALSAPSADYAMPSYQDQSGKTVVAVAQTTPTYGQVVRQGEVADTVRVLPRHVYENRVNTLDVVTPPKGYRTVWEDDRLNPRRAEQTFAGKAAMEQIWDADRDGVLHLKKGVATEPATNPTVVTRGGAEALPRMLITPNAYVQVAAYADGSDARAVAKKVRSLGLPVRVGHVSQAGQTAHALVLAGPFSSHQEAQNALQRARSAGYKNAIIR